MWVCEMSATCNNDKWRMLTMSRCLSHIIPANKSIHECWCIQQDIQRWKKPRAHQMTSSPADQVTFCGFHNTCCTKMHLFLWHVCAALRDNARGVPLWEISDIFGYFFLSVALFNLVSRCHHAIKSLSTNNVFMITDGSLEAFLAVIVDVCVSI